MESIELKPAALWAFAHVVTRALMDAPNSNFLGALLGGPQEMVVVLLVLL